MKCFNCNSNCRNGSYKCWNCGRVFKRNRPYVKQVNIQKNYFERDDQESGAGLLLGIAAAIGGYLYLTHDKDK